MTRRVRRKRRVHRPTIDSPVLLRVHDEKALFRLEHGHVFGNKVVRWVVVELQVNVIRIDLRRLGLRCDVSFGVSVRVYVCACVRVCV